MLWVNTLQETKDILRQKNGAFRKCKQKFTRGEKNLLKCLKTE